jgi:hypothetical protein
MEQGIHKLFNQGMITVSAVDRVIACLFLSPLALLLRSRSA